MRYASPAVHTDNRAAAREELRLLAAQGLAPDDLVWVHAQNDPGPVPIELARQGVWIRLDGFSLAHQFGVSETDNAYLNSMRTMGVFNDLGIRTFPMLSSHGHEWLNWRRYLWQTA